MFGILGGFYFSPSFVFHLGHICHCSIRMSGISDCLARCEQNFELSYLMLNHKLINVIFQLHIFEAQGEKGFCDFEDRFLHFIVWRGPIAPENRCQSLLALRMVRTFPDNSCGDMILCCVLLISYQRLRDHAPLDACLFLLKPFNCAIHGLPEPIEKIVVIFESRSLHRQLDFRKPHGWVWNEYSKLREVASL